MGKFRLRPGAGVMEDVAARLPWYMHDWREGMRMGFRIFAPSTYIFFASVLPALAFGQQLNTATDGILTGVNVLVATGIAGIIQALVGGQPLLIVGVAEPIVLLYIFMYDFAKDRRELGRELFLAWTAWVCIWTAAMCLLLAVFNICDLIKWFTRFSGELFGALIAVLFAQEAIKGWKEEFQVNEEYGAEANEYTWRLVNGLWGLLLGLALVVTALLSRTARSWRYTSAIFRSLLADYGPPLMVLVWTLMSYAVSSTPSGVPRRLPIPNTWNATSFWTVTKDMGKVPLEYILAALIPALIITILFFFDHSVSAQLAQVDEFNLRKPSAYNYDFFLLGIMTLACGLLGLPPVNGVLPQAPLHTKSLATLKREHVKVSLQNAARQALKEHSKAGEQQNKEENARTAIATVLAHMQRKALQLDSTAADRIKEKAAKHDDLTMRAGQQQNGGQREVADAEGEGGRGHEKGAFDVEKDVDEYLQVEVAEQRVSGFLQSSLVLLCLVLTPILKKIPSAVIYGYFLFMAIESLPGSQLWDRLLLLITDPKRRYRVLEKSHAPYLQTVRFRTIVAFTAVQLLLLASVWALTYFAGVAGSLFPLPIIALIPIRIYILPRMFPEHELEELDSRTWEEVPALPHRMALREQQRLSVATEDANMEIDEETAPEEKFAGFQIKHRISQEEVMQRVSSARHEEGEPSRGA